MFVETRIVNKTKKYYLVHSYRIGNRIHKVRIYLGINLSGKEIVLKKRIAEKKIEAKLNATKSIKDPYQTVLASSEINVLKGLEPNGKIKLQHLSKADWLKFTELFTYDTNAIEGSTVDKLEVKGILERNEWPNKSKNEISETFGVAEAVRHIRTTKDHLSVALILELHKIVFKNSKPFAGIFRKKNEEVVVMDAFGNVVHRGAPSTMVISLLKELVNWYKKNKRSYPPLVLASIVHNQFENIHPFRDGNGRIGRLLLVTILLKHNLPPVNIELKNRAEYYAALQNYEKDGNIRPTIELLLKEYKKLKTSLKGDHTT